ncbi:MAG: DUF4270 family protein [Saprospiraceae bacterium]
MKISPYYFLLIVISVGFLLSIGCNKATTVGSGLVDDEDISLGFTDELIIKTSTVEEGRIPTFFMNSFTNESFMVGALDDPIFGKSESVIHFEMLLSGDIALNFAGDKLDSMVFIFGYNRLGNYGDTTALHDIKIYRLGERLDGMDTLYSNQEFEKFVGQEMIPIGSLENFRPNAQDSITIVNHLTDEELRLGPQIRVRMDQTLANAIFADTLSNKNNESLRELINGFVITSTPQNGNSMFGVDLVTPNRVSGVEVFYTTEDDTKRVERYVISGVRQQTFTTDHSGTPVEMYLNQDLTNGEPLFVQGLDGVVTEVDISSVKELVGKSLNQVQLRFFLDEAYPGDFNGFFPPAESIILTKASTGERIEDVNIAFNAFSGQSGIELLFGGILQDSIGNNNLAGYSMNVTTYAKAVQKGQEDGRMHIEVFKREQTPRRVILFGSGHPTKAPKMRVTFTVE